MENVEIWKNVIGYEGIYKISNLGNVKSLKFGKEKILIGRINKTGYSSVILFLNKKAKNKRVHQLVAEAFLGHIPCGMQLIINHKNFIKTDNRLENLEIVTSRENSNLKHLPSSSKYTGVGWHKMSNKWCASIHINGKHKHLGLFKTEIEASECYENAVVNHNLGLPIATKDNNLTSKFKGVSFRKLENKWTSSISKNNKRIHLGLFNTEIEAHEAYQKQKSLFFT